jgi:hypothetical protein
MLEDFEILLKKYEWTPIGVNPIIPEYSVIAFHCTGINPGTNWNTNWTVGSDSIVPGDTLIRMLYYGRHPLKINTKISNSVLLPPTSGLNNRFTRITLEEITSNEYDLHFWYYTGTSTEVEAFWDTIYLTLPELQLTFEDWFPATEINFMGMFGVTPLTRTIEPIVASVTFPVMDIPMATETVNDVNFFSDITPTLIETIDLKEYLIDIGDIDYSFQNTDNNELYFEDSDINFTCSGIKNSSYLYDFLGINQNTQYTKYMVTIGYTTSKDVIWRGLVNQETIKENFSNSSDSEVIEFQALGFLKEFKEYYSNKRLPYTTGIQYNENLLFSSIFDIIFANLDNDIFNIQLEMEDSISDYYIMTFKGGIKILNLTATSFDMKWIKTCYERIYDTNENCFGFLQKICNAMGWIFYIFQDKFYIKNRSSTPTAITDMDFNNFIEYTAEKTKLTEDYDTILIKDGYINLGDSIFSAEDMIARGVVEGNYFVSLSKNDQLVEVDSYTLPFQKFKYRFWNWTAHLIPDYKFQKNTGEDDANYNYAPVTWKYHVISIIGLILHPLMNYYSFNKKHLLIIDGGNTDSKGIYYNKLQFKNYFKDDYTAIGDDDIWMSGNYGNCLYRGSNSQPTFTYADYLLTDDFKNNFNSLFSNILNLGNVINVKYNELFIDPMLKFRIINNEDLRGEWTINKAKYNLKDEISELELQKRI